MELEKSKVSIQCLGIFRQSGDVLFFLYARRLRGYTATLAAGVFKLLLIYILKGTVRVVFGHHMRVGFCLWAIELTRVVRKIPHFGIGIV